MAETKRQPIRVLVVDDDPDILVAYRQVLDESVPSNDRVAIDALRARLFAAGGAMRRAVREFADAALGRCEARPARVGADATAADVALELPRGGLLVADLAPNRRHRAKPPLSPTGQALSSRSAIISSQGMAESAWNSESTRVSGGNRWSANKAAQAG